MSSISTNKKPTVPKPVANKKGSAQLAKELAIISAPQYNLSSTNSDIKRVPEFARAGWIREFLPRLYLALGCSKQPFDDYNMSTKAVERIQGIVDDVWAGTDYTVKWGDGLMGTVSLKQPSWYKSCFWIQAIDRLNDKRSCFGSRALKAVEEFFNTPDFIGKPAQIKRYAEWAIRGDGPAVYGTPTPCEPVVAVDHPSYQVRLLNFYYCQTNFLSQKPRGLFKSAHVQNVMSQYIRSVKALRCGESYPIGALAMTATAVSWPCIEAKPKLIEFLPLRSNEPSRHISRVGKSPHQPFLLKIPNLQLNTGSTLRNGWSRVTGKNSWLAGATALSLHQNWATQSVAGKSLSTAAVQSKDRMKINSILSMSSSLNNLSSI